MTQTYRTNDPARWGAGQGFNLSPAQVDINFWDLVQRMLVQEARPDPAAGIDHFEIVGTQMYVHLTDGTILGPYELPIATFNDRGPWAPGIVYAKMDTFSINGGLYVVIFPHTSGSTFDPGANDGAGNDYYKLMIQTPGSSLPFGGQPGMLLKKFTTTDYVTSWGYTSADLVSFTPAVGSILASDNVADALEEAALSGGDADNIPYTPSTGTGLTANSVAGALDELGTRVTAVETGETGGGAAVGRQTIWIPASAMTPRVTNGPSIGNFEMPTNKNMVRTLDFDPVVQEFAQFDIAMPLSWDKGDLAFQAFWSHGTATVNFQVNWNIDVVSIEGSATLDVPFEIGDDVTDTGGTINTLYAADESGTFTVTLSPGDVPGVYRIVQFQIWRDPPYSQDTLGVDARLHGIKLFYVTNAATDDAP